MASIMTAVLPAFWASVEQFLHLFDLPVATVRRVGVQVLLIWLMTAVVWVLIRVVARRIVARADDGDSSRFSPGEKQAETIAQLLQSVGRAVLLVLAGVLTLNQFMDIGPLLGAGAVFGLAISFGSQSLVKDVIGGFFILLEKQFWVGDIIEAAGRTGTVERITLRVVMLRDAEGVLHIIPNSQISTVSNKTTGWSRAVLDIGVGYEADIDSAIASLRDECRLFAEDPAWGARLIGVPEVLGVQSLADSAVMVRVLVRTEAGNQATAAREFLRRVKVRLDRDGIEIPYPQRTIHVRHHGPEDSGDNASAGS
jgi:small-conductance mechanosensitive channel